MSKSNPRARSDAERDWDEKSALWLTRDEITYDVPLISSLGLYVAISSETSGYVTEYNRRIRELTGEAPRPAWFPSQRITDVNCLERQLSHLVSFADYVPRDVEEKKTVRRHISFWRAIENSPPLFFYRNDPNSVLILAGPSRVGNSRVDQLDLIFSRGMATNSFDKKEVDLQP